MQIHRSKALMNNNTIGNFTLSLNLKRSIVYTKHRHITQLVYRPRWKVQRALYFFFSFLKPFFQFWTETRDRSPFVVRLFSFAIQWELFGHPICLRFIYPRAHSADVDYPLIKTSSQPRCGVVVWDDNEALQISIRKFWSIL